MEAQEPELTADETTPLSFFSPATDGSYPSSIFDRFHFVPLCLMSSTLPIKSLSLSEPAKPSSQSFTKVMEKIEIFLSLSTASGALFIWRCSKHPYLKLGNILTCLTGRDNLDFARRGPSSLSMPPTTRGEMLLAARSPHSHHSHDLLPRIIHWKTFLVCARYPARLYEESKLCCQARTRSGKRDRQGVSATSSVNREPCPFAILPHM